MKASGIVHKIDDLGRVVIPQEIRGSMKIKAGDPLEFFISPVKGMVCFQKYSERIEEECLRDFNEPIEMPTNFKSKSKRKDYELQMDGDKYLLHLTEDEVKLMNWLESQCILEPDEFGEVCHNYDAEYGESE